MRLDFTFCPGCGAKVVKSRLTFKGLFEDIAERVFNLENSFYRTLRDMTLRPEKVILKYVEGTRRRYMAPMNYLALALALSGVTLVVMRKYVLPKLEFDVFNTGMTNTAGEKIMNASLEYNSFIFILYIPMIALSGWLALNKREHNIPEYTVTATYILSHFSFLTFFPSLALMIFFPESYMQLSFGTIFLMYLFALFAAVRTHSFKGLSILGRGILFFFLFVMGFFGVSIALNVIFLLTGVIEFSDLLPKPVD